jgi:hypothetical protein
VLEQGFNASNTIVVTVSSDYSSIVGQIIRHNLSYKGEIADGFSVDVPYPDQTWDSDFIRELVYAFFTHDHGFNDKTLLLVEAGVIRGGNYNFLTEWIFENYPEIKVKTLTLFENTGSAFKSDFVGKYYNDKTQDLTFSWEKENNHWNK